MKKIARMLTAVVAATAAAFSIAPAAQAAPGNTVLLGDSYFANTSFAQLIDARLHGGPQCIKGDFRVATELTRLTGAPVADYSCNGTELYLGRQPLEHLVDRAIAEGQLNGDTRNVPIMIGANDTYRSLDPIDNVAAAHSYDRIIGKVRQAAPNARIQLVSYPTITNDRAGLCLVRLNGLPPLEAPFGIVRVAEDQLWHQAHDASVRHNVTFVDLRNQTRGHDMCQPGRGAWVAGVFDNQSQYNLTVHMTNDGVTNAAQQIANTLI